MRIIVLLFVFILTGCTGDRLKAPTKWRCRLGGFIKSVYNTPPKGGSDGNGPEQPLLRKLTEKTALDDKRKLRHRNLLLFDSL
jgi:hypothetical protein